MLAAESLAICQVLVDVDFSQQGLLLSQDFLMLVVVDYFFEEVLDSAVVLNAVLFKEIE